MLKNNSWFTLIEIILWILIFSMVVVWWFQALSSVNLWKIKLIEKTDITKDAFYFSEKLFDEIKKGWTIDYEEYFNRKVVWYATSSWHYTSDTWFWNFWNWWIVWSTSYWNWFYYCRSTTTFMWTWWCYNNASFNNLWISWWPQRYWQYVFNFIDYNSNLNNDYWDEDLNWNIRWDDDDEYIWDWPVVFTWWTNVKELYLISWDRKKRTIFRWNWSVDPNKPPTSSCGPTTFWSWCLWTVEFLKLEWKDWGLNHNSWSTSTWSFDWIIDTWIIDKEFTGWAEIVAWSNNGNYRQPLFPDSISVTSFEVYLYPNIDKKLAWKWSSAIEVNPYVRIKLTLSPSWKKRRSMKWVVPEIKMLTTLNLTDYFSK